MRMSALTEEQLVVDVYVQVIAIIESSHVWVRWDQIWGAGGHGGDNDTKLGRSIN